MEKLDIESVALPELGHLFVNLSDRHFRRHNDELRLLEYPPGRSSGDGGQQHVAIGDDAS